MFSVSKFAMALCLVTAVSAPAATLRVCSDPNNLPYSNEQKQGFENQIAELIAKDMGRTVEYFWFPQREKFFKKTLNKGVCDVVIGVPVGFDEAATTQPYYQSTYVFITRRASHLDINSLDDARLRTLKIGVQILGDENDNLPPVNALLSRGIVRNLVGFSIFGNLNEKNPAADVIHALEDGKIDVAIVWGPLGGYFSQNARVPLQVRPIDDDPQHPDIPMHFDIAMGVRARDTLLRDKLNSELEQRRPQIEEILRSYGIPQAKARVKTAQNASGAGRSK